jgi:hypothetical protein
MIPIAEPNINFNLFILSIVSKGERSSRFLVPEIIQKKMQKMPLW